MATLFDWEDGSRPEDVAAATGASVYDLTMHLSPLSAEDASSRKLAGWRLTSAGSLDPATLLQIGLSFFNCTTTTSTGAFRG